MKFWLDFGPLLIFFGVFHYYGIYPATGVLIISSLIAALAIYLRERKIPTMHLITAIVVLFFGGMSLLFHDERFIKMKPTIVNLVFAGILFIGVLRGKGLLKYLFGEAMQLSDSAWKQCSFRYACFFLLLAVINEVVWRNASTEIWVNFKVFGLLGISFLFTLSQINFFKKHMITQPSS